MSSRTWFLRGFTQNNFLYNISKARWNRCCVPFSEYLPIFVYNFLINNERGLKVFASYLGQWPWQHIWRSSWSEVGPLFLRFTFCYIEKDNFFKKIFFYFPKLRPCKHYSWHRKQLIYQISARSGAGAIRKYIPLLSTLDGYKLTHGGKNVRWSIPTDVQ